jgi:hypothetical protein
LQDKYQLPTAFHSEETHAKAAAFAVGSEYWSAIRVDDDYYYTYLSRVSDNVNDRSMFFLLFLPTYGMVFPMYSGSVMCFNPHLPHGTTEPTDKGVRLFSAYISGKTCNTQHEFVQASHLE